MQPTTRKEFYLAKLAGESVEIPSAITREETYLAYLCGSDIEPPMPITADEMYLAAMCGMVDGYPFPFTNLQHIWADLIETGQTSVIPITCEEYYWTTIDLYSIIYSTKTGPIVSFTAKRAHPLRQLVVAIEPVQSGTGTPSPDNVRPITGWSEAKVTRTGANVWDEEWEIGEINNSTGVKGSGTLVVSKNYIPVIPGNTYYWHSPNGGTRYFYSRDKSFLSVAYPTANTSFTVPSDAYFMMFKMPSVYGTTYNNDISINYPATDHDYHAYSGTTLTIDLDGTRYGGTLDVLTGVLTVNTVLFEVTSDNLNGLSESAASTNDWLVVSKSGAFPNTNNSKRSDSICSHAPYKFANVDGTTHFYVTTNGFWLAVPKSAYPTFADFTNSLTGNNALRCVTYIASPQTVQLTAQQVSSLAGTNVLFADAGNVTVEYRAS